MGKNSAIWYFLCAGYTRGVFCFTCRGQVWPVCFWRYMPACPGSDPILLSCAKKNGVGRQEEVAQRKPLKGFPLDSFGNKRAAALLRSREFQICIAFPMGQSSTYFGSTLFLACKYPLVCKKSDDFPAEQQIWQSRPPQGIFALQKSLRVGCDGGTGVLIAEGEVPAQRNFQRKFALRRVGSAKFVVPPTIERSKVREHAQLVQPSVPGSLGCQRGRAPLFPKESREKPKLYPRKWTRK